MDVLDYLFVNGGAKEVKLPKEDTKTDLEGYFKSPSGAVICKNNDSLTAYKSQKAKNAQLNNMKKDIDELKSDMKEIKELLKGLVK